MDDAATSLPDPAAARAMLADARSAAGRTTRQARWWVLFMAVFALGFGSLTLLVGSAEGPWELVPPMVAFGVLTVGMLGFARSRPVQGGIPVPLFLGGWIGTSVLYGVALWTGRTLDWPLWAWVVAALVVAAPLAVAAVLASRSLR